MIKIAILDDWQDVARSRADWSPLAARAELTFFAALDVFDKEPPPPDHRLRACRNAVLTPHIGYGVDETWRDFYSRSVENALAFLDGAPIRVVKSY